MIDTLIFTVDEARRLNHPVFSSVTKYLFTVRCKDLPPKIGNGANSREPLEKDLNKRIYRSVLDSLKGVDGKVGTFDLKNKGIIILADSVEMDPVNKRKWIVKYDRERGGIVDGGHTAFLIWKAQETKDIPDDQYVDVYIRTGISDEQVSPNIIAEISEGLNTSLQVRRESILDKMNAFEWIKQELDKEPRFSNVVKYAESDDGDYYIQDIIGVMECLNINHFPEKPDKSSKNLAKAHPTQVATSIATVLNTFCNEFDEATKDKRASSYESMSSILLDAMRLFETIQAEFPAMYDELGGRKAGALKMVDVSAKPFGLLFANVEVNKKLYKQATYPIFAAFRNYITKDKDGKFQWKGGFERVLGVWKQLGPTLVQTTIDLKKDIGTSPDQIAKHKPIWKAHYDTVYISLLEEQATANASHA